jgi:Zn-dependent protease/CBS domain-containing protein
VQEHGFRLGSILGFEIRLDASWFVIFFLLLWSLSAGFFPSSVPGQATITYVVMGVTATILFFASLIAHEISHSLVARSRGIPMAGITLFIFGGMAHATLEPDNPGDELLIAGVGPLVSLILGGAFLVLAGVSGSVGWSALVGEVARYLGFINMALAAFNLLPGFPLDGGRIFRATAWKKTGDLARATTWATNGGRAIGIGLVVFGGSQILVGALLGGLWMVFIGLFLRGAADTTLRQFLIERTLQGISTRQAMSTLPPAIQARTTLGEWIHESLMATRHSAFPVENDNGHLVGIITLDRIEATPRERWSDTTIRDIMIELDPDMVVSPGDGMNEALRKVRTSPIDQVLVLDGESPVGLVTRGDVQACVRRATLAADR